MQPLAKTKNFPYQCKHCGNTGSYYWGANGKSVYSSCHACEMAAINYSRSQTQVINLTPDELYKMGYEDGKSGKAANASNVDEENYKMGYDDGRGDREQRPVAATYADENDPPEGFVFTGEKRVPDPGEYYLSKNGNAILAKKVRGNNQTRWILLPD